MTLSKNEEPTFRIADAGKIGNEVFSDIVKGVRDFKMKPINGYIEITIDLIIADQNVFKDDESRTAKIKIRVDLEEIKDLIDV